MYTRTSQDTPKAHEIHLEAEKTREEDRLDEALELYDKAIELYEKDENYAGMAEAYLGKFLTYKHVFLLSKSPEDGKKGKEAIEKSEEIAREFQIDSLIPTINFEHGSLFRILENYSKALPFFEKALETFNRTGTERGDYRYHLGFVQYKFGQKEVGKKNMLLGLEEVRSNASDVTSFAAHVWESGCLMCLAECLWEDDKDQAVKFLHEAQVIIDSDSELVIRKRQLSELKRKFGMA